jgi:hypothetical protein
MVVVDMVVGWVRRIGWATPGGRAISRVAANIYAFSISKHLTGGTCRRVCRSDYQNHRKG